MVAWIEPLNLEVWIASVFAGTPQILSGIALLVIFGIAGYLRMPILSMFFMLGVFLLMFTGFISASITTFIIIIGGLLIGFTIARISGINLIN